MNSLFLLDIPDFFFNFFFGKDCLAPLANFSAWSQVALHFGYNKKLL